MDTTDKGKCAAMEAGRKYLKQCAQLNGVTIGEFVDSMLACDAVGCDDVRSVVVEFSFRVADAVPLDVDIPGEHWIQWCDDVLHWCCDVEDEFRTRPRPMILQNRSEHFCLAREE